MYVWKGCWNEMNIRREVMRLCRIREENWKRLGKLLKKKSERKEKNLSCWGRGSGV